MNSVLKVIRGASFNWVTEHYNQLKHLITLHAIPHKLVELTLTGTLLCSLPKQTSCPSYQI